MISTLLFTQRLTKYNVSVHVRLTQQYNTEGLPTNVFILNDAWTYRIQNASIIKNIHCTCKNVRYTACAQNHLVGQSCTRKCIKWEVEIWRERMSLNVMFSIQFTVWACGWYWLAVQPWNTSAFKLPLRRYRMTFHERTKTFLTSPWRRSLTHTKQDGHQSGFKVYSYEYITLRFI